MELLQRSFLQLSEPLSNLTVMQWNVLADQLARDFPAVSQETLSWDSRRPMQLAEIIRYNPDIICLEEVDHFADFLEPELRKLCYTGIFHKKPGWHHDGCAIFYRENRFLLNSSEVFPFAGNNQFALGVRLTDNVLNKEMVVYVTHLKAKKAYESIRVTQVEALLSHLAEEDSNIGLIVCGDFNSLPEGPAYAAMLNNQIGLRSAYKDTMNPGEVLFTTIKHRLHLEKKTEDYIWIRGFGIQSVLTIPREEEIGINGLPSPVYPSDHFSLVGRFY